MTAIDPVPPTTAHPTTAHPTTAHPTAVVARRELPSLLRLLGVAAGLGAVLTLLLAVFIMPSLKSGPHDLAVGVVSADAAAFTEALATAAPGAYETRTLEDAEALESAVRDRDVVGGFVVDPEGVRAVVASAGSTAISGTLASTADAMAEAAGTTATVTDLVPLPQEDPTGIGIGGLAFPLVFGGIVPAVAFRAAFPGRDRWKLAGLVSFAALGGVVVAAVLRFLFGSIEGALWPVAGAMGLCIAALAVPLTGLQQLFGAKGFTLGAMTMMFLGNPLAGIATTGDWLPSGLGELGQALPPGAAGSLVRSTAYFDGAGGLTAGLTLGTWVVVGALLHAVGTRRTTRAAALAD